MDISLLPNTVLEQANARQMSIRPMKLQKLMYFSCGLYAASCGGSQHWLLPENADFRAYTYGPLVEEIYECFRKHGQNPIDSRMWDNYIFERKNKRVYSVINAILERFGRLEDFYLSHITHEKGSPWANAWAKGQNSIISKEEIYGYYKRKLHEYPMLEHDRG